MTYNPLRYTIDKPTLLERVKAEVSQVADLAYTEDGTSLYDLVMVTEKDTDMLERQIDDAAAALVSAMHDLCTYAPEMEMDDYDVLRPTGRMQLVFYTPDLDDTQEEMIDAEITRYLSLYVALALFRQRRAAVLPEFEERVKAAADNVIVRLRTRTKPRRQ